jgi:hypothetical protein
MKRTADGRPNKETPIRALIENDPVCLKIVSYLARHNDAADTAQGIADWWIHCEPRATEAALTKLAAHAVVRAHLVQHSSVYALTRGRQLRELINRSLKVVGKPLARESD